jgi:LL-diaminopimelate aminotransferase
MTLISTKISSLRPYAFAEMDRQVNELKAKGIDVIDFGTGDPRDETPVFIREALKSAADLHRSSGYPSSIGLQEFRQAIANWYLKRFQVILDPETEITTTIGSKEGIFHFPFAFVNPGDAVIIPSPGYPPYKTGTLFAGGVPYFYPLFCENDFYPQFESIPKSVLERAKIFWICYPNSPTGKLATREFLEQAAEFCAKHNIILASDECYVDLSFQEPAMSALQVKKKGIVAFHSLSKRNNMTGYRVGFVCGDSEIIAVFKKLKTNIDSGTPNLIQEAAIKALQDDQHVALMREEYRRRQALMLQALADKGLLVRKPESTFYLWQCAPKGMTGVEFSKRLLLPDIGIAATPGEWISEPLADGTNPGQDYVRFALVESEARIRQAAQRLKHQILSTKS